MTGNHSQEFDPLSIIARSQGYSPLSPVEVWHEIWAERLANPTFEASYFERRALEISLDVALMADMASARFESSPVLDEKLVSEMRPKPSIRTMKRESVSGAALLFGRNDGTSAAPARLLDI